MGNSNKVQQNVIHIEFMTAKQKIRKDKALIKNKVDQSNNEHLQDIICIQDLTQYYEVDFRQTILTSDETIHVKKIVDLVVNPNSKTPNNLIQISEFFKQNVKSFQIFFNNQMFSQDEQQYQFAYEPLYIEVIYKPKHWMEKAVEKFKTYSNKIMSALGFISKFAYIAIPLYTSLSALQPFLMPTLKTAKVALRSTQNPQTQTAQSVVKFLINTLKRASYIAAPLLSIVGQYMPMSKTMVAGIGLYLGKGMLWNVIKLCITIFCPFVAPLLMIFG
ncbi:unnamed protein product [Paramecium pentaurelia]|uniref:Uncharacterized protein n=1 Tax=Paramecium pentaurelia TaxID=43138 RepID=A0A8S1U2E3_9CILI|nr:unnamed protein product [Paramecium pentaurelia]